MTEIIVAIITGGLALLGVILSNNSANKKIENQLDKNQAVTDTKVEELTREVRKHNNFAERMPVLEEKIKVINHRIDDLEHKKEDSNLSCQIKNQTTLIHQILKSYTRISG